eukprot:scaffold13694_cov71-Cyclotella_meneghiniana.AAC.1
MGGKYIAIWLPVSTFVSIGFEHSVAIANMFLLPAGLMSQDSITVGTALTKNLIPVTIGNALSGSLLVGATFSYLFGTLGKDSPSNYTPATPSQHDGKSASEVMISKVSGWITDLTERLDIDTTASLTTTTTTSNLKQEATTVITNDAAAPTSQETTNSVTPSVFFASPVEEEVVQSMEDMVLEAQRQAEKMELLMRQSDSEETMAQDRVIAQLEAEKSELLDIEAKAETAHAAKAEAARVAELEAETAMQLFREAEEEAARLEDELAKLAQVAEVSSSTLLPLVKEDESLVVDEIEEVELKQPVALDEAVEEEMAVSASAPEVSTTSVDTEPLQVPEVTAEVTPTTPPVMAAPTQSVPRSSNLRDLLGPNARRL